MALKAKATKNTSKSTLGKKARSKSGGVGIADPVAPEIEDRSTLPSVSGQATPPPPPLLYLNFFSTIPSLRRQNSQ